MSCAVLVAVGLAYGAGMGVGAYLGLFQNQLNLNIPFLLLGPPGVGLLGVDARFCPTTVSLIGNDRGAGIHRPGI